MHGGRRLAREKHTPAAIIEGKTLKNTDLEAAEAKLGDSVGKAVAYIADQAQKLHDALVGAADGESGDDAKALAADMLAKAKALDDAVNPAPAAA